MDYLTVVCRQPRSNGYTSAARYYHVDTSDRDLQPEDHLYGDDGTLLGVPEVDKRPTGGDQMQCGQSATFAAVGLTAAGNEAIEAGWIVDDVVRGEFSREDICPGCNPYGQGGYWRNGGLRNPSEVEKKAMATA